MKAKRKGIYLESSGLRWVSRAYGQMDPFVAPEREACKNISSILVPINLWEGPLSTPGPA